MWLPNCSRLDGKANALSDLYSLGVLLFEAVTGKLPFSSENQIALVAMHVNKPPPSPRSIVAISPQVEGVMLKVLEKKPELRYRNATELAEAFCQAAQGNNGERIRQQSGTVSPLDASEFDRPLVLAPPPSVTPVARPVPLARSTGGYPAVPENRQTPAYQASGYQSQVTRVRRRSSPVRTRTVVVTIMALLVLLAVVGPIMYVALTIGSTIKTATATATATAKIAATAMQQAQNATAAAATQQAQNAAVAATQQAHNATATAIAGMAATAQAQATATAGVIQTATTGNPSYIDTLVLNNPENKNWDQNTTCTFMADGYHVMPTGLSVPPIGCRNTAKAFLNVAITVDMKIVSGSGGVFFRVKATGPLGVYSGYLFEVARQGNFTISRSNDFTISNTILKSGVIQTGWKTGVGNTLQIIARGNDLSFYVNGFFLISLRDNKFSSGNIAFTANGGSVIYTNLNVFTLS